MKLLRHVLTVVWLVASLSANAGEAGAASAKDPGKPSTGADLQLLQGKWEGYVVGEPALITVTITTNSLHFFRDAKFWFLTTISLPADTNPKQFHAIIKDSAPPTSSIGEKVVAIFKLEDGLLTIAPLGGEEDAPKSFEAVKEKGMPRYELRKVQPGSKEGAPSKPNEPQSPVPALPGSAEFLEKLLPKL